MRRDLKLAVPAVVLAWAHSLCRAQTPPIVEQVNSYVQPYVHTNNFSGVVLVEKDGKAVFEKAYGFANREQRIRNDIDMRFHIASVSMQFTAIGILRLADLKVIHLDDHIGDYVPGIEGANGITIRDLLVERSGLPDINGMPDYDEILQEHQTPASLVSKIQGKLLFDPGTKFLHEEHPAYNLLALIIENKIGLPFAAAMNRLVFQPFGLKHSGVDDDSVGEVSGMAKGYQPKGTYELEQSKAIHWSGKAGNGSAFTTAKDAADWVRELFGGQVLSKESRDAILDSSTRVGFGWFRGKSERFGETVYYMNGRAPGFASFVLYLPNRRSTVVVLSNIYSSASTAMGNDIAAIALGLPYEGFPSRLDRATAKELATCEGRFRFGEDFYQPNGIVTLSVEQGELLLHWDGGGASPLIPLRHDQFIDRSYWETVRLEREPSGTPVALLYGKFRATATDLH